MLKAILLTITALIVLSSNADARQRHRAVIAHERCNIDWPCEGVAASPRGLMIEKAMPFGVAQKVYKPRASRAQRTVSHVEKHNAKRAVRQSIARELPKTSTNYARDYASAIAKPIRYIAGRLVCATNVNAALAERGIKGTGSALAKSFLSWGRSAGGPVPGAVIVSNRRGGGHVAIVSRVENGVIYAWNATGGQRGWREIPYRKAVIDYRVPG